ncbi:cell wall anchor protein [Catellatospora sp. KI3]|uniref:RCC1 domain-containing protein n=1 Tax=Catellatospora sp. KI3 TaxID=3041620 RepID=UPI002482D2F8|nr:cell wall anchor protein [Catellatospora sp. KI3]MDI1462857.1 cell wall anchor protein [Catellatospora sp. KI3]
METFGISRRRVGAIVASSLLALPVVLHDTSARAAALSQAQAVSWGINDHGQLGDSTLADRRTAGVVIGLEGVKALAANGDHSLALLDNGTVRAWGENGTGQLGDGSSDDRLSPVAVAGVEGAVAVAAGEYHGLILLASGKVLAFGNNSYGQLGIGDTGGEPRLRPVEIPGLSNVKAIAAGQSHSLALLENGKVMAWGWNEVGQLGIGVTGGDHFRPEEVVGLSGVKAISSYLHHTLALLGNDDRTVKAWGSNTNGELGNGVFGDFSNRPVDVLGLSGVQALGAGNSFSCALRGNGKVKCWGTNGFGNLGLGFAGGPGASRNRPTDDVLDLSGVRTIAVGDQYVLALLDSDDDIVKGWGTNLNGQLGDGTYGNLINTTPVIAQTTLSHVDHLAAGRRHSLAAG